MASRLGVRAPLAPITSSQHGVSSVRSSHPASARRVIEVDDSGRDRVSRPRIDISAGESAGSVGISLAPSMAMEEESGPLRVLADEDIGHQLSRDSSEDENIQFNVPPELISSLLE